MKITYNNKIIELQKNQPICEILKDEIINSEIPVIGAVVNNEYKRLDYKITEDSDISLLCINSKVGMKMYRSTLIYILAMAFEKLYPNEKLRVNYQLSNAMY